MKSLTVSIVSTSICHKVMGPTYHYIMISKSVRTVQVKDCALLLLFSIQPMYSTWNTADVQKLYFEWINE